MKLVIVGGVAGGASAAARARRLSEDAHIVLFERGPNVSFANCGLPYFIGGEIADRDKLLVVTPERLRSRFKLDVRVNTSVLAIDRGAKKIRVRDLEREYEEAYDKLILATGAAPLRPPIPGIDLPGIFTLRNMQDMDRIKERVDQGVERAVVIGAGFIGLELVENLVRRGIGCSPRDSGAPHSDGRGHDASGFGRICPSPGKTGANQGAGWDPLSAPFAGRRPGPRNLPPGP
jgi:NADPH-dependent 2,4-dienoyl-CoA reductase/sulfur reductase-like enzyme